MTRTHLVRKPGQEDGVLLGSLPGPLPAGERLLWQGRPEWQALARDALHVRGLAAYMTLMVASVAVSASWHGGAVFRDTLVAAIVAIVPVAVVLAYSWLAARGARYAITDRRVVMRVGVALPMTFNVPFARIESAGLRTTGSTGEIALKLLARDGLAAIMLWPHSPLGRTQPVLRGLVDADKAGQVLARALAASVEAPVPLAQTAEKVETLLHNHGHDPRAVAA